MERLQNMRNNAAGDGETNCAFYLKTYSFYSFYLETYSFYPFYSLLIDFASSGILCGENFGFFTRQKTLLCADCNKAVCTKVRIYVRDFPKHSLKVFILIWNDSLRKESCWNATQLLYNIKCVIAELTGSCSISRTFRESCILVFSLSWLLP